MAAPTYIAASTGATSASGNWTATCHAPGAAGRVLILQVLQDGTATSPAFTSATNIEDLAGTDNQWTSIGEFNVGSGPNASQHLWIGRSLSTSAPTFTGANAGGDDLYWRYYEFTNVNTGTAITDVIENSTAGSTVNSAGTSATASDAGVTTLGADRLALDFIAVNDDNAIAAFTGETGGDWAIATAAYATATGTDGAIQLQTSALAYSASTGGSTAAIWGATGTNEQAAQSFAVTAAGTLSAVVLNVRKYLSPTDDLVVELQADASGVPSGTALTSASISGTALTTTPTSTTFTLAYGLSVATYWVVLRRTGARDFDNAYGAEMSTGAGPYAGGSTATRASGTWSTGSNDLVFSARMSTTTIDGGTASITDSDAWGVVGFALIGTTASGMTGTFALTTGTIT
jgi:hypothetical protein